MQQYLKKNFIIATYGAVKPIPLEPVLDVVNTYSKKDIALFFGSFYLDKTLDKITEDPYISTKSVLGKTYRVKIVDSKLPLNPLIKFKFDMPATLTKEQRLNMSWFESLSLYQDPGDMPHLTSLINTKIANGINDTVHSIVDHGFAETTYQAVLEDDIKKFKNNYKVYDAKR